MFSPRWLPPRPTCHSQTVWWYFSELQKMNSSASMWKNDLISLQGFNRERKKQSACVYDIVSRLLWAKKMVIIQSPRMKRLDESSLHPVVDGHYSSAVPSELKQHWDLAQTLGSPIWFGCVWFFFFLSQFFFCFIIVKLFISVRGQCVLFCSVCAAVTVVVQFVLESSASVCVCFWLHLWIMS